MRRRLVVALLTIAVVALAVPTASVAASTPKKLPRGQTTVKDINGKPHHVRVQVTEVKVVTVTQSKFPDVMPGEDGTQNLVANGYRISGNGRTVDIEPGEAPPIPITERGSTGDLQLQQLPPAPPGSCQVLDLNIAPIHLSLLGLIVDTENIHVRIVADPAGGLLGDLLCSLAGNGGGGGPPGLGDIVALLEEINATLEDILAAILGG
jgi:hypothetical protein